MENIAKQTKSFAMHETCPICRSHRLKFRWQVNGYSVVRCEDCSLVFVQEALTPDDLAPFYSDTKDSAYEDSNLECLNFYYKTLRKLIEENQPNRGRLLDVGCSAGWFLDVMEGWECHGTEITKSDAETARQKHGDRIFEGSFENYPDKPEYFDVITLQDVFDHMPQPLIILEKCRALLKPTGLIVIKVHNMSCLYAKISGSKFYAIMPPFHLFYYNEKTLFRILKGSGFQPVRSMYLAHLLKISTIFYRLSKGKTSSPFYFFYKLLGNSAIGQATVKKNLHDIITVFAVKA